MAVDRIHEELEDFKDEAYFDEGAGIHSFDSRLLREPVTMLRVTKPVTLAPQDSVTDAVRGMQAEHRGAVVITEDGSPATRLTGIFTERDVLFRIVDQGRNPATLPLSEVMTVDPEVLPNTSTIAYALNKMSLGGFRHIPVVDEEHRPAFVVSVRDVVGYLVEAFPREVFNLPDDPSAPTNRSREGA
ncbi:MAG: CBS domain-containing protein [Longimicrobiales bacterium]